MAPGGKRKVVVPEQHEEGLNLSEEDLDLSEEGLDLSEEGIVLADHEPSTEKSARVGKKRGRRKPTKGTEVRKRVKEGSRINGVMFVEGNYRPVGPAEKLFKMETGVIARQETPHHILHWKSMDDDAKKPLFDRLESEFQICLSDPHTREVVDSMLSNQFRNFKYRCHLHYKKFTSPSEARRNPPISMDMDQWIPFCEHFESEKFQLASEKNTANRNKVAVNHAAGSKSFCQRIYEMDENENLENPSQEPKEVRVYYDVHHKKDGNWIHPQAMANYEKMTELCKEPSEDDVNLTGSEIVNKVVKKSSKARGNSRRKHTSASNYHTQVQAQEILNEKLESQQAVINELLSSQKLMNTIIEKLRRRNKKKKRKASLMKKKV